jgi:hypothetical protein
MRDGRRADLRSFGDQADAERAAVAQAGFRHLHVALLEDPQRQAPARENDGVQREDGQVV